MTECPVAKLAREANDIANQIIAIEEATAPTVGGTVIAPTKFFDGEMTRLCEHLKGVEGHACALEAESVAGTIFQLMCMRSDTETLASFTSNPKAIELADAIDATLRRIIAALERVSGVKAEDLGGKFYL